MPACTRYLAAACQTDFTTPHDRAEIASRVAHMLAMIDRAVVGYRPFGDVKLLAFPEFGHAVPIYETVAELSDRLAVEIPNEHTDLYVRKAREFGVYIQTATFIERDSRYPGCLFNTTCLIGPEGLIQRYRKVHPWLPWEVHASPHDIPGYDDPLFPVADTEIGRIGAAICYDWLFPEAIRELALQGAEVLVRVSAYMDPWRYPTHGLVDADQPLPGPGKSRVRSGIEPGASGHRYPPFTWPGGSMVVDYDGRILTQADPGPGEKIVVAPIDLAALARERERRIGHHMLAHLRTEAYSQVRKPIYPGGQGSKEALSIAGNEKATALAKRRLGAS